MRRPAAPRADSVWEDPTPPPSWTTWSSCSSAGSSAPSAPPRLRPRGVGTRASAGRWTPRTRPSTPPPRASDSTRDHMICTEASAAVHHHLYYCISTQFKASWWSSSQELISVTSHCSTIAGHMELFFIAYLNLTGSSMFSEQTEM